MLNENAELHKLFHKMPVEPWETRWVLSEENGSWYKNALLE